MVGAFVGVALVDVVVVVGASVGVALVDVVVAVSYTHLTLPTTPYV